MIIFFCSLALRMLTYLGTQIEIVQNKKKANNKIHRKN